MSAPTEPTPSLDERRFVLDATERLVLASLQGLRHLATLYAAELNTPPPIEADDVEHVIDERWWALGSMLGLVDGLAAAWARRARINFDERVRVTLGDVEDILALDDESRALLDSADHAKMEAEGLRRQMRALGAALTSAAALDEAEPA